MEVISIIAVIIAPIASVAIGQWLQNRSEKRKDKMQIFKTLMTSRIYGWTVDSVNALNIIDIVFVDDNNVRTAWKDLFDKYRVESPTQMQLDAIEKSQYKLLEAISNSLGYKNKITWETIQNPYIPKGMTESMKLQQKMQNEYSIALSAFGQQFNTMNSNESVEIKAENDKKV